MFRFKKQTSRNVVDTTFKILKFDSHQFIILRFDTPPLLEGGGGKLILTILWKGGFTVFYGKGGGALMGKWRGGPVFEGGFTVFRDSNYKFYIII